MSWSNTVSSLLTSTDNNLKSPLFDIPSERYDLYLSQTKIHAPRTHKTVYSQPTQDNSLELDSGVSLSGFSKEVNDQIAELEYKLNEYQATTTGSTKRQLEVFEVSFKQDVMELQKILSEVEADALMAKNVAVDMTGMKERMKRFQQQIEAKLMTEGSRLDELKRFTADGRNINAVKDVSTELSRLSNKVTDMDQRYTWASMTDSISSLQARFDSMQTDVSGINTQCVTQDRLFSRDVGELRDTVNALKNDVFSSESNRQDEIDQLSSNLKKLEEAFGSFEIPEVDLEPLKRRIETNVDGLDRLQNHHTNTADKVQILQEFKGRADVDLRSIRSDLSGLQNSLQLIKTQTDTMPTFSDVDGIKQELRDMRDALVTEDWVTVQVSNAQEELDRSIDSVSDDLEKMQADIDKGKTSLMAFGAKLDTTLSKFESAQVSELDERLTLINARLDSFEAMVDDKLNPIKQQQLTLAQFMQGLQTTIDDIENRMDTKLEKIASGLQLAGSQLADLSQVRPATQPTVSPLAAKQATELKDTKNSGEEKWDSDSYEYTYEYDKYDSPGEEKDEDISPVRPSAVNPGPLGHISVTLLEDERKIIDDDDLSTSDEEDVFMTTKPLTEALGLKNLPGNEEDSLLKEMEDFEKQQFTPRGNTKSETLTLSPEPIDPVENEFDLSDDVIDSPAPSKVEVAPLTVEKPKQNPSRFEEVNLDVGNISDWDDSSDFESD
ncbi:hypothetical protein PCE1_004482 [Barthelona sp. PCE]